MTDEDDTWGDREKTVIENQRDDNGRFSFDYQLVMYSSGSDFISPETVVVSLFFCFDVCFC